MKINLASGSLYSDSGELIKKMVCPRDESWQRMVPDATEGVRRCSQCQRKVTDISFKSEAEVLKILKETPSACLHVDLKNSTIRVISHAP